MTLSVTGLQLSSNPSPHYASEFAFVLGLVSTSATSISMSCHTDHTRYHLQAPKKELECEVFGKGQFGVT